MPFIVYDRYTATPLGPFDSLAQANSAIGHHFELSDHAGFRLSPEDYAREKAAGWPQRYTILTVE
jgi:hypothetical protein